MPSYCYLRKQFVPLSEAKIGVMTHALHYGTAAFCGIRGNWNEEEGKTYLFRPRDHFKRLLNSCRILKIDLPYSIDDLCRLAVELVEMSGLREDVYLRPLVYKSSEALGVQLHGLEGDFLMFLIPWGPYLANIEKGIRCCTSSWRRVDDTMIPPRGKICGLYVNNALAKTEAIENGFEEAILLTHDGHVSEGSGENVFLVIDNKLVTPPSSDNSLVGITQDSAIKLAQNELGMETIERSIDRSELYLADECFLTGTAAHVTPVIEIDHRKVGDGAAGKVTLKLQKIYFDVIRGRNRKYLDWCMAATPKLVRV